MLLKVFGWSFFFTVAALVGAIVLGGPAAAAIVAILIVLEVSLSFDNAVVNATILERMSPFWQRLFLTVGVLIAVFGMRLVFPLLIVGITSGLNPIEVVDLALKGGSVDEPGTYAQILHDAHPTIAAFGGMFLMMLFLNFIFEEREITWLRWIERPLAKAGRLEAMSIVVALAALVSAAKAFGHTESVLVAGTLGILTYLVVDGLGSLFEDSADLEDAEEDGPRGPSGAALATGKAAFFLFLYLEILDASFSFDGVIGAFAITQDIFIITVGLGVGALYVRSLTIYLVRKGTLNEYVYLEHGAMWAIGALATILLVSIKHEIPEVVTGLVGVGFIALAFLSSVRAKNRAGANA